MLFCRQKQKMFCPWIYRCSFAVDLIVCFLKKISHRVFLVPKSSSCRTKLVWLEIVYNVCLFDTLQLLDFCCRWSAVCELQNLSVLTRRRWQMLIISELPIDSKTLIVARRAPHGARIITLSSMLLVKKANYLLCIFRESNRHSRIQ